MGTRQCADLKSIGRKLDIQPTHEKGSHARELIESKSRADDEFVMDWSEGDDILGKWVKVRPNGIVMSKTLLILMLMATQLLAGTGGSLYLCISNDGSCCCFDVGPESCTCGRGHKDGSAGRAAASCDCGEVTCQCHECHETSIPESEATIEVANEDCGCVHIPLMVSVEQPTRTVRSTIATDAERLALLIASLPSISVNHTFSVNSPEVRWNGPPAVPEFALTVISTVVMRC